jgi:hypothetical protein
MIGFELVAAGTPGPPLPRARVYVRGDGTRMNTA